MTLKSAKVKRKGGPKGSLKPPKSRLNVYKYVLGNLAEINFCNNRFFDLLQNGHVDIELEMLLKINYEKSYVDCWCLYCSLNLF